MQKRFLAILVMVATVFALGVGSALAERPGGDGTNPACEKDDPPAGCEDDGHPGDPDEEEPEEPEEPGDEGSPLDALCDALGAVDPAVADVCQQIVDALAGGGGEPPALPELPGAPEPGGEPSCADIPVPELAAGCQELVDAIGGGGQEPPALPELPGAPEPGGEPSCADVPVPELAAGCQSARDALGEAGVPVL